MGPHDYMHARRGFELKRCVELAVSAGVPRTAVALEIGAGTGFQAQRLTDYGFRVSALEVSGSAYREDRVFAVQEYDGIHLPFEDASFDFVFSSNVLEHVPSVDALLLDSFRVTRPGGVVIHVLPTPAWRAWSMVSYYPWAATRVVALLSKKSSSGRTNHRHPTVPKGRKAWVAALFPARHGEFGNALTELCWYRRSVWLNRFCNAGFEQISNHAAGLFYSNSALLADRLPMYQRQRLAHVLGSACRIYVMRRPH